MLRLSRVLVPVFALFALAALAPASAHAQTGTHMIAPDEGATIQEGESVPLSAHLASNKKASYARLWIENTVTHVYAYSADIPVNQTTNNVGASVTCPAWVGPYTSDAGIAVCTFYDASGTIVDTAFVDVEIWP